MNKIQIRNIIIILLSLIIVGLSSVIYLNKYHDTQNPHEIDSLKAISTGALLRAQQSENKVDSLLLLEAINKNDENSKVSKIKKMGIKERIDSLSKRYNFDTVGLAALYTDFKICEIEREGCIERSNIIKNIITEKDTIISNLKIVISKDSLIDKKRIETIKESNKKISKLEKKVKIKKIFIKVLGVSTSILAVATTLLYLAH